jgi:hypothetical protein
MRIRAALEFTDVVDWHFVKRGFGRNWEQFFVETNLPGIEIAVIVQPET